MLWWIKDGDGSIGVAFHICDGYFIAAKHVLDSNRVQAVSITHRLIASATYH